MAESSTSFLVVPVKLPPELVDWIDLHVAELHLALRRAGRRGVPAPSRSSFIREELLKVRRNHDKK